MNKDFFCLKIETTDTMNKFIDYQVNMEPYKDILTFAKSGQKILKRKGKDTFVIFIDERNQKTFSIPDCKLRDQHIH